MGLGNTAHDEIDRGTLVRSKMSMSPPTKTCSEPIKRTWLHGFSKEFLSKFQENNPLEHALFLEYADSYNMNILPETPHVEKYLWEGFQGHIKTKLPLVLKSLGQGLGKDLYGPENALNFAPGLIGSLFNIKNTNSAHANARDTGYLLAEALALKANGPQYFNETLFREIFRRGYKKH